MPTMTLKEAASLAQVSEQTLRRRIKSGKLPASIRRGQYYIDSDALMNAVRHASMPTQAKEIPLPTNPDISQLLTKINEGFKSISEENVKIAARYQETVQPIVNHYISSDEQAFFNKLANVVQTLLNNAIMLIKTPNVQELSPSQIAAILSRNIDDIPQEAMIELLLAGFDIAEKNAAKVITPVPIS